MALKRIRMSNKYKDRRVFEVTANRVHKQNLDTKYSRGCIRF